MATGRTSRVLLWSGLATVSFALLVYHVSLAAIQHPPAAGLRVLGDIGAMLGFLLLAYLAAPRINALAEHPTRALWLPILASVLGFLLALILVAITGGPATVEAQRGVASSLASATQIVGIAMIEIAVAVVLLYSLKSLILFRRTQASERNWTILMVLMAAAAVMLIGTGPLEDPQSTVLHVIFLILAVIMMVANAFRLAWIVYLPFRQKIGALGLCTGLCFLLIILLASRSGRGTMGTADIDDALSAVFSVPVSQFVTLLFAFGILYSVTAILALLFHLPTASALEQKSGEMEALQALAKLSSEVFDHDKLVDTIARAPVEAGVAQAAWLALIEPESGSLRPRLAAVHGLTTSQVAAMTDTAQLADDVCHSTAPIVLGQAPADHRVHARPGDGIGSLLVLPLRAHDEPMGAIFATRAVSHGFERDDVAALETFAAQAALALSNARLFVERIERERMTRELAIAREVQQRLLPDVLPCSEQISCAALSLPAQEVAGDFYDVLDLPDDRVGLIVADVSGKGTPAAFHMAELKGIFQSVGRSADGPAEFLDRANEALGASLHRTSFISAIYAIVDEVHGTVTLARAGHCPALLVQADGSARHLRPPGIGLGLDRGGLFRTALKEQVVALEAGDLLVLYTDGLVEARNPDGDEYGYENLLESAQRHHNLDPEDFRDALVSDLQTFARHDGDDWEDDLTLLVLRWTGSPAPPAEVVETTHADLAPVPA